MKRVNEVQEPKACLGHEVLQVTSGLLAVRGVLVNRGFVGRRVANSLTALPVVTVCPGQLVMLDIRDPKANLACPVSTDLMAKLGFLVITVILAVLDFRGPKVWLVSLVNQVSLVILAKGVGFKLCPN